MIRRLLNRGVPELYQAVHNELDRFLLMEVFNACQGNQVAAAELLGIARNTLRTKLRTLGLQMEKKFISDNRPQ